MTIESRVARLEAEIASLSSRLDALVGNAPRGGERVPENGPTRNEAASPPPPGVRRQPPNARPRTRDSLDELLASKSLEWWLARGGAILTCLAVILLYQYAVERNWITPLVRIGLGSAVGAALFVAASRSQRREAADDTVGLRELLIGAGLSAWYITAYAAAVLYGIIPASTARLIFLVLSIAGAWLALREQRSLLAVLALGAGFLAPVLLPSPVASVGALSLYLAALSAVGLIVYVMRGWASTLWLVFIAFWWSAGVATELVCCDGASRALLISGSIDAGRVALTLLVVVAAAVMVQVPLLRRRVVALGSDLYTEPAVSRATASLQDALARRISAFSAVAASPDSPALWVVTILTPLIGILVLSWTWTSVAGLAWGAGALVLAAGAYRLALEPRPEEVEVRHVEAAATALWALAGLLWIADWAGARSGESPAAVLAAASVFAFANFAYLCASPFVAARRIGLAAAACAIITVLLSEMGFATFRLGSYEIAWTTAELLSVATAAYLWRSLRRPADPLSYPSLIGIGAYLSLMLVDARVLGRVWPPLVTASFAIAGTALLVWGRERAEAATVRKVAAFTLIVVVARLFIIDLARVETIWRVLLFLGCGALFLFASQRMQQFPVKTVDEAS